ncbi:MAG: magnesium transporter CorA family protein [Chloroflexi bacterium]|nr:magnesium transporter CorA family protein [Chloroflexota bacterium]
MVSTRTEQIEPNIQSIHNERLRWVNIENPSTREMRWLGENYPFHTLDLDDCLSRVQLPKIDEYENYIFLLLHFPIYNRKARITQTSQVAIFVGENYVVTVHTGELRPLGKLFRDCQSSESIFQDVMKSSSGYLLYRILDGLVDYCFPILNKVIENVNKIEDGVFDEKAPAMIREISIVRRDIIAYHRIVRHQAEVLKSLEEKEFHFLKVNTDVYFGDLADHTRRIWVELEEMKEVIAGLADAHSSLNSHQTSDVIRTLTIIATIMLPLSVVTGLWGMNLALPLAKSPWAFLGVMGIMATISAAMLTIFRVRHWF